MRNQYIPAYSSPAPSDEYSKSTTQMDVIHTDRPGVIAGYAQRTGITCPGYVTRAVYRLYVGGFGESGREPMAGYWVYEDGAFVGSTEWHHDAHNLKPEFRQAAMELSA